MTDDRVASAAVAPSVPAGPGPGLGQVLAGLALLAFAGVTGLFAPFLVMASDGCYEGDARTICSAGGQQFVGTLPVVAAFVAALLAVVGMSRREGAGPLCLLAAPCVLALTWVVCLAVAGG